MAGLMEVVWMLSCSDLYSDGFRHGLVMGIAVVSLPALVVGGCAWWASKER